MQFKPRHRCKQQMFFLLDVEVPGDVEDEALMWSRISWDLGPSSIWAFITADYLGIWTTIDWNPHWFGSTHNFIDPTTAKQIGCLMHARECLNIMVAIGSKFPCHGKCPNMWLTMRGYQLHTNIYALLLGACDIIFGSQWLLTLCPILWDFNEWKMQFSCYGKGFTLKERRMEQIRLWMLIKMQRLIHKRTPCAIA